MELLGPSIQKIFNSLKHFTVPTICHIGAQIIDGLQFLHNQRIIHCDLKLENFAIGREDRSKIFLFDFGLSKTIPENNTEVFKINNIVGSLLFMSRNAHQGIITYRNDIESLAYVLAFLVNGRLPWDHQTIEFSASDTGINLYDKIFSLKTEKSTDFFKTLPDQIRGMFQKSMELSEVERPDFEDLKKVLLYVYTYLPVILNH